MPEIFDIGALVRPVFDDAQFTPTKWDSAQVKAGFANELCRFIATDFKLTWFTEKLYRRLSMTFGHIAHTNRYGFIAEFFEDLRGKVSFIEQTMSWRPVGDPAWTYSDVERAVLRRMHACDLLAAYRALRAAEIEGGERELLRRLQAKYAGGETPSHPPFLHCPPTPRPNAAAQKPSAQARLDL